MTTIGVLGIIFGCFGLLTAVNTLFMPMILEFQRKAFGAMQADASNGPGMGNAFPQMIERMLAQPPAWFGPFTVVLGILSLAIAGVYVFGGIWLLLIKPSAPRILCAALIASMVAARRAHDWIGHGNGPDGIRDGASGLCLVW
jgi:hypothetical protein